MEVQRMSEPEETSQQYMLRTVLSLSSGKFLCSKYVQ